MERATNHQDVLGIGRGPAKRRDNFLNKTCDECNIEGVNGYDENTEGVNQRRDNFEEQTCNDQNIEGTKYFGRETNKNLGRLKHRYFQIDRLNKSRRTSRLKQLKYLLVFKRQRKELKKERIVKYSSDHG